LAIAAVRGMKDILPGESALWQRVERCARETLERFGYRELRTPILERTELFARSIGEATDIVSKEMYTFEARGGESLTMRPEATAGVVRAYIEHALHGGGGVQKLYSIGPMFRYERPQKGRYRQFWQINAEALGLDAPELDAETIHLMESIVRAVGARDYRLEVNSLGCPDCRAVFKAELQGFLRKNVGELCPDCQTRAETNPLRVFDCKSASCRKIMEGAPLILDFICADCRAHFDRVLELLGALGSNAIVNPRIVRGLDYYRRTTFEISSGELGAQNAFGGGGRYDGLVKDLGGPDVPGIGFAIGMDRLMLLLPGDGVGMRPVFLATLGEAATRKGFLLGQELRARGVALEMDLGARSLKAQMRAANRANARAVLILGDDELAQDRITLRDMDSKEQEALALDVEGLARRLTE